MSKTIDELIKAKGMRDQSKTVVDSPSEDKKSSQSTKHNTAIYDQFRPIPRDDSIPTKRVLFVCLALITTLSLASLLLSYSAFIRAGQANRVFELFRQEDWNRIQTSLSDVKRLQASVGEVRIKTDSKLKVLEQKIAESNHKIEQNDSKISQLTISANALRAYMNNLNRSLSAEISRLKEIQAQ